MSSADSRSQASLGRSTVAGPLVALGRSSASHLDLGGGVVGLSSSSPPPHPERAAQATRVRDEGSANSHGGRVDQSVVAATSEALPECCHDDGGSGDGRAIADRMGGPGAHGRQRAGARDHAHLDVLLDVLGDERRRLLRRRRPLYQLTAVPRRRRSSSPSRSRVMLITADGRVGRRAVDQRPQPAGADVGPAVRARSGGTSSSSPSAATTSSGAGSSAACCSG